MGLMKLLSAGKSLVGIREGRSKYRVTKANLVPKSSDEGEPAKVSRSDKSKPEKKKPDRNPFGRVSESEREEPPTLLPVEVEASVEVMPEPGTAATHSQVDSGEQRVGTAAADAPAAADTRPVREPAGPASEPRSQPARVGMRKPKSAASVKPSQPPTRPAPRQAASPPEPVLVAAERKRKPKPAMFAKLARLSGLAKSPARKPAATERESWLKRLRVVRNDLADADLEVVPTRRPKTDTAVPGTTKSARGAVARFVRSRKLPRLMTACLAWI
jgi:hypothetical protein